MTTKSNRDPNWLGGFAAWLAMSALYIGIGFPHNSFRLGTYQNFALPLFMIPIGIYLEMTSSLLRAKGADNTTSGVARLLAEGAAAGCGMYMLYWIEIGLWDSWGRTLFGDYDSKVAHIVVIVSALSPPIVIGLFSSLRKRGNNSAKRK